MSTRDQEVDTPACVEGPRTTNAPHGATNEAQLGRELFVFTAQKAGMKDVDKDHVQKVVYDLSKDSKFFQNSMKQNQKVDAKIQEMHSQLAQLSELRREKLQKQVDNVVVQLEATRDLTRTIVVVDMDMFYAAVEMRDSPKLRDVPLAVGGLSMISTTNYIARKFGVRAAMPGFIGKELCPELVFVPPNFKKYTKVATQIREIFASYDPNFSAFSLDEARLDITEYMETHWPRYCSGGAANSGHGDGGVGRDEDEELKEEEGASMHPNGMEQMRRVEIASAIVAEIRDKIFQKTELTASAGIAANTMLAKIASDMNKPNGQFVLPFTRESVVSFIQRQPVRKIGGIGKVMEKILAAIGITTGKDLFTHRAILFHLFTEKTAPWLLRTCLAIQEYREATERKSFSRERTFRNVSDPQLLEKICSDVCGYLADDMERGRMGARTLTLKLKCADFSVRTRSVSFASTLKTKDELFEHAVEILRKELPLTLRLLGVRGSSLVSLAPSAAGAAAESGKRQLGIDRFTTTKSLDSRHSATSSDEKPNESAESAGEDDSATDSVRLSLRNTTKKEQVNGMASFVTPISKDPTPDIVAAMLDKSSFAPPAATVAAAASSTSAKDFCGDEDEGAAPRCDLATSFQPCPICGKMINVSNTIAINTHVDACIVKQHRPARRCKSTDAVDPFAICFQPCPICGEMLNASNSILVNTHIDACILMSSPHEEDARDQHHTSVHQDAAGAVEPKNVSHDEGVQKQPKGAHAGDVTLTDAESCFQPCPICGKMINASNIIAVNTHIDACMSHTQKRQQQCYYDRGGAKKRRRGQQQHSIQSFFASK